VLAANPVQVIGLHNFVVLRIAAEMRADDLGSGNGGQSPDAAWLDFAKKWLARN
jgi:hypothetical protein